MKCPYCNAEIPDDASFCPHCASSLKEKKQVEPARPFRRKAMTAAICAVIVFAAIGIYAAANRAGTYEANGAWLSYADRDGEYDLIATFHPGDIENKRPVDTKSVSQVVDEESGLPVMIGVYKDGELLDDPDEFFSKSESCTLSAVPVDESVSGDLTVPEPSYDPNYLPAARVSIMTYTGKSGTNDLYWTIVMKNGDTLRLRQTFEVKPLDHLIYTADDVPLDTIEDIEALIGKINEEAAADSVADIYLPAQTYTGDLSLVSRSVNIFGDPDGGTVLQGSLTVNTDIPFNMYLTDISFEGQGGIGLSATASVFMERCSFTGYDIGAVALDGGMIAVHDCTFTDNGVGFKYNSVRHSSFDNVFPNNTLTGNDIGVQFARLEGTICIVFEGTVFKDNRVDIDNPIDYPIDTSDAEFH